MQWYKLKRRISLPLRHAGEWQNSSASETPFIPFNSSIHARPGPQSQGLASINTGIRRVEFQFNRCGRKSSRCRSLFFAKAKYVTSGTLLNILTSNVLMLFLDPWNVRNTSRSRCVNKESSESIWFLNALNTFSDEPTKPIFGRLPKKLLLIFSTCNSLNPTKYCEGKLLILLLLSTSILSVPLTGKSSGGPRNSFLCKRKFVKRSKPQKARGCISFSFKSAKFISWK